MVRLTIPRVVVVAAVALLATAALTYAATTQPAPAVPDTAPAATPPAVLTVPDVTDKAYVFAKGILEERGFAWKVSGNVRGFAANTVVAQSPAGGMRLVDTGMPLIVLTLRANGGYTQSGEPENASPYAGTKVQLADVAVAVPTPAPAPAPKPAPAPAAKKKATPAAKPKPAAKQPKAAAKRPPAFAVPGAPAEPLDEMPLPDRARALSRWLDTHREPSNANVNHFLYQHSWIVTGAKFGWWRGAEALRLLAAADRKAQQVWGIGARSESLALSALAEVEARS